jgi:hypothetical protein
MQIMTPGPFLGSMPSPDTGGARLARQLDLICSGLAILASAAIWLGAWLNGPVLDIAGLARAGFAVLLAASLMGIVLTKTVSGWERFGAALILEAVGRRLGMHSSGRAVRLAPAETPARGIAGLVEALVGHVERLNAPPSGRAEPCDLYAAALHEVRAQAQSIIRALYQDADVLNEASSEIEAIARNLDAGGQQAGAACAATESAIIRAEQHLVSLTGAVAATTAELRRVTEAAVSVSEQAFAGQRGAAALDDSSTKLLAGLEHIQDLLKRASTLGQSPGVSGAAGIRDLAQATRAATAALRDEAAGMSAQVATALRTANDICAWVTAQHDLGLALSNAVGQQAEEIAALLRSLEEARSGFATLRAGVDAVTRLSTTRLATTDALQKAAGRLPAHADAVATLLYDLSDFP